MSLELWIRKSTLYLSLYEIRIINCNNSKNIRKVFLKMPREADKVGVEEATLFRVPGFPVHVSSDLDMLASEINPSAVAYKYNKRTTLFSFFFIILTRLEYLKLIWMHWTKPKKYTKWRSVGFKEIKQENKFIFSTK